MQTIEPSFQRRIDTLGVAQQTLTDHGWQGEQHAGVRHPFHRLEVRRRFAQLTLIGKAALDQPFDRGTRTSSLRGVTLSPLPGRERGALLSRPLAAVQASGLDRMTDRRFTPPHLTRGLRLRAPLVQARLGDRQDLLGELRHTTRCTLASAVPDGFQTPLARELPIVGL